MTINESIMIEIDYNWINETKKILCTKFESIVDDLISTQIKKLPIIDTPKTLKTVEVLYKELEESDSEICNIFYSKLFPHFSKSYLALLSHKLKIQMATNQIAGVLNDPSAIAKHIKNFGISENDLLELLRSLFRKDPHSIACKIKNFGIKKHEVLKDIAELIAKEEPYLIALTIKNFEITEQEILIKIAELVVQNAPLALIRHIKNFKISDQKVIIKIVKLIAQTHLHEVVTDISNFEMRDQVELVKLAVLWAQQNPFLIAMTINRFKISSAEDRIEVAKTIVQIEPDALATYINQFEITDQGVLIEFAKSIAQKNYKALLTYLINAEIDYTKLKCQKFFVEVFNDICKTNFTVEFSTKNNSLDWLLKKLKNSPWDNSLQQKRFREWMVKIISASVCKEDFRQLFIEQQPLISQISKLEPHLRDTLTQIYIDLSSDQKQTLVEFQYKLYSETHLQLTTLLLATYSSDGKDIYQKALQNLTPLRKELRKGKNQKLLVETLIKIKNSSFLNNQKLNLIHLLFESKDWQVGKFQFVVDLIAFKAESHLNTFVSLDELKFLLEALFKDRFNVKINDFSKKYEKTIGNWRNKEALITYASKLNELGTEKEFAHKCLQEVIQRVLEGNFQQNRYRTDNNPHLREIENSHSSVFKKWQEGCQLDISEIQSSKKESSILEKLKASIETYKEKVKEFPIKGLDIYKIDLLNVEEELRALKPKLEISKNESSAILESIKITHIELAKLKKEKKDTNLAKITEKTIELETLKEKLNLNLKLLTQEALLIALTDPLPENLILLQNFLYKEIEFYKKNEVIAVAIKELSRGIETVLDLWSSKGILAEEDFETVLEPIREGLIELIPKDLTRYLHLQSCLENGEKIKNSIKQMDTKLKELNLKYKSKDEQESIKREQIYYLQEKAFLEVLKKPETKQLQSLRSLFTKEDAFYPYIERALEISKIHTLSVEKKVMDTDDANHFLLMGTEVINSCQKIDGNPDLNKCLLGYFLDGKHRLALICDKNGKILARSVLRLLIDEKGNPILFQEKLYVTDANPEYNQLIRKIAIKKAQSLSIPLVVSKKHFPEETGSHYLSDLYAKDKPVPFEYVDALEGPILTSYKLNKDAIIQVQ